MTDRFSELYLLCWKNRDSMISLRRDFHAHPELGWCEIRTASRVAAALHDLGYTVLTGEAVSPRESRMGLPSEKELDAAYTRAISQGAVQPYADAMRDGATAVVGILDCGPGPVVAMRFDMDALPIQEAQDAGHLPAAEGFASRNPGVMHACGHDGHTAVGLTAAKILYALRDQLHGTLKLIFQPAEEGVRGAASVAASGILDDVNYLLGSHVDRGEPGISAFTGGSLATTKLNCTIRGFASHAGSAPELGSNAMLAAATAVLNLHAMPRHASGTSRINVGTLHAGSGRNVICDRADLELEVRGGNTEVCDYLTDYAARVLDSAARMHGCTAELSIVGRSTSLRNDGPLMAYVLDLARRLGLPAEQTSGDVPVSEDMALLSDRVRSHGGQSLYFYSHSPCAFPAHNPRFDFREDAMDSSLRLLCAAALDLMAKE